MATVRTVAPSSTNKYYISTLSGGYNRALRINSSTGSCLPNCVGYVNGAFSEMLGKKCNLGVGNAKTLYYNTSDGYSRGKTPKLGACICWGGGKYGHVGIVVAIYDSYILVAQSNYGGARFEVVKCYKMSNGGYKSHGGNTNFQGFIYCPITCTSPYHQSSSGGGTTSSGGHTFKKFNATSIYGRKPKTMTVTTSAGLWLRGYPKTGTKKKLLSKGTQVLYYGNGYYVDGKEVWYCVQVKGSTLEGYVYGGIYNSGKAPYLSNANP